MSAPHLAAPSTPSAPSSPSRPRRLMDAVAGIFRPLIPVLTAAGVMKGILALLLMRGMVDASGGTYTILYAMADSLYYFLPIMLGFSAAKVFGADPYTAAVIGGVLLYPTLTALFEAGTDLSFFGLPIRHVTYASAVIPTLFAVGLLVYVERGLKRIVPTLLHALLVPLLSVVLVSFTTLAVFGPLGTIIGEGLARGYAAVYGRSPVVAGALLGLMIQPMVIFGFHWSFILIGMNNITTYGEDTVLAIMGPPVFAQAGAALATMLKQKDRAFRAMALSATVSALFGVTEPVLFGINLPRRTPLLAGCLAGSIGSALAGYTGVKAMAFALPSLATLPVFVSEGFGLYVLSWILAFVLGFVLSLLLPHHDAEATEKTPGASASIER